jgi:glycosyltransferase involved in cell wall biosynthesis
MSCRVAVDVTPELAGSTGVARYSRELGRALDQRDDCEVVRFAIGRGSRTRPDGVRHLPVPLRVVQRSWRLLGLPRAEHLTGRVDIVHSLDLVAPPTRVPLVVTVHDLVAIELPDLHPRRAVRTQRRRLDMLGEAAAIVTDSQSTAEALAARGIEPDRLHVIPLGLTRLPEPAEAPVVDGPFVLAVGTLEPRKGHELLIRAFGAAQVGDHRLVFAGPTAGREQELMTLAAQLGIADRLTVLGAVTDAVLARCYRDATLLCMPSLAEGFGLPVLEAMGAGVPAVASDIPVLRDLAGDGALLVPAGDVGALARALERVIADQSFRLRLREQGSDRAAAFTWEAAAEATVRVYEHVMALAV